MATIANAPWLQWDELTGADIDAIDRSRAVVHVAVSPIEVHGPHLPTMTDNIESRGLSSETFRVLQERHPELVVLNLPPIYVASDVLPHVGSIQFRPSTITRVLEDLGRSLVKQGFKRIWVSSFHGGPRHFVPIEVACQRVNKRYGGEMVSVFGTLLGELTGGSSDLGGVLGELPGISAEDMAGDAHGGAVETSIMLHLVGDLVKPVFDTLEQVTVDLKLKREGKPPLVKGERPTLVELFRGFRYKIKFFEQETYAGKPAVASAEAGKLIVERLALKTADALEQVYLGRRDPATCVSPLWKARWAFTFEPLGRAFEAAVDYRSRVW